MCVTSNVRSKIHLFYPKPCHPFCFKISPTMICYCYTTPLHISFTFHLKTWILSLVLIVCIVYFFAMLDANEGEVEGEEFGEGFKEDQGQAN
jgi:hypothetical protein